MLDYRLAQLLQRARTRLTQVKGLQVVDVVLVVLGDHVQPELLSPLCRLSLLFVLLSLLLRSLLRGVLLCLGVFLVVHLGDHRERQVQEEETSGEHQEDEVNHAPSGAGVHSHVHDGRPPLKRDALEDRQPGVPNIVEVGNAVVGVISLQAHLASRAEVPLPVHLRSRARPLVVIGEKNVRGEGTARRAHCVPAHQRILTINRGSQIRASFTSHLREAPVPQDAHEDVEAEDAKDGEEEDAK
mmetsp:Transcript_12566/g.50504  ORF Transcript_12566/g.50504 Transcript_12566/m.50504 type:complete len:242 (+) Transcript_12566:5192-5917(+)